MMVAAIPGRVLFAVLVGLLAGAGITGAMAKPACTPVIDNPDDEALEVSVTPEIVIDPNRRGKCHIKETEIAIETADGDKTVLNKTITHKSGIGATGPLPTLKVRVDPGVLDRNTAYRVQVTQYPPQHLGVFHEDIGTHLDRVTFVTEGGFRQSVVISSRHRDGGTDYTLEGRKGARYLTGNVGGIDVTRQINDKDRGNQVTGRVSNGADGIYVRGSLTRFDLADPTAATLFVRGDVTDVFVIDGSGGQEGRTSYTLETKGAIDQIEGKIGDRVVSKQRNDEVRGQRARGYVASGADGFLVSGRLKTVDLKAPDRADLHVNGRPAHTVVVDGSDKAGRTAYRFAAQHRVEKISGRVHGRDVSIQGNDRVKDHRRVDGTVVNGADGYLVLGDIQHTDVALDDPAAANVYIDGARAKVDFDQQAPGPDTGTEPDFDQAGPVDDLGERRVDTNQFVIDGSAAPNKRTNYRFQWNAPVQKVDGKIGRFTVSADKPDRVTGNSVEGAVGGGLDGYTSPGVIRKMSVRDIGAAHFYFNGERSDHALVIDGTRGSSAVTDYTVRVAGIAQKVDGTLSGRSVSADEHDKVRKTAQRGTIIDGVVGNGRDGYLVLGEVLAVELDKPSAAEVSLDGKSYQP